MPVSQTGIQSASQSVCPSAGPPVLLSLSHSVDQNVSQPPNHPGSQAFSPACCQRVIQSGIQCASSRPAKKSVAQSVSTVREPAKWEDATTANAERPMPKAAQKTTPKPTPNPRPCRKHSVVLTGGAPPRPRVQLPPNSQSASLSVCRAVGRPVILSVSQPPGRPVWKPSRQPARQSTNQSVSQKSRQPAKQSANQSVRKSVLLSVSQSVIQSFSHPVSRPASQPVSQ